MYECPNCGGNLKFDIPSQLLKCDYCETTQDPYQVTKDQDAEENDVFDVTVFTCPQCGGEIMSTDTSAAEFCSFCGASTILSSRISRELRPAQIIPFKQTREACKKAYIAHMKRSPFAPDELKDEKHIDSFRGIYMPYWSYDISQKGPVFLKGKKSYTRGDYTYTDEYDLSGRIDASYNDLSFDASSSFADSISEQIAPFNVKDKKEFTPSFLSGFYADTSDVDSDLYKNDAIEIANNTSYDNIRKVPAFSDLKLSCAKNSFAMTTAFHTWCDTPRRVMYPVWFMSYRKNNRVAYATVNGQTGKVAADIPVDLKKYVLGSVLLALPVFLLLNLFFTIKPKTVLAFAGVLAIATFFIYMTEMSRIFHRDKRHDDRGYLYRQTLEQESQRDRRGPVRKSDNSISLKDLLAFSATDKNYRMGGALSALAATAVAALIWLLNPISDIWYYAGTILSFLGVLFTVMEIIKKYNVLATRRLPQFDRSGGDDRA